MSIKSSLSFCCSLRFRKKTKIVVEHEKYCHLQSQSSHWSSTWFFSELNRPTKMVGLSFTMQFTLLGLWFGLSSFDVITTNLGRKKGFATIHPKTIQTIWEMKNASFLQYRSKVVVFKQCKNADILAWQSSIS